MGKLVNREDPDETGMIAGRILAMDLDVLAIQEVENVDILREFIDVGILSRSCPSEQ